jgi:hypothetical protein
MTWTDVVKQAAWQGQPPDCEMSGVRTIAVRAV